MPSSNDEASLHVYYRTRGMLPTFGDFREAADLGRHERARRALFEDRLHLPARMFRGARLLEFGPDGGENAMAFAHWGARLTLVEPNPLAVDQIRAYFRRFGLESSLEAIHPTDLARFGADRPDPGPFDFIIAEGFIFTVKPDRSWMDLFLEMLAPDGFAVVFTHDPGGMFCDLLLKAAHARFRALTGLDSLAAARRLFQAKWDAIPHTRPLEAWVMDQLDNPFVRLAYCHDPARLAKDLAAAGLCTWSSWPPVRALQVHWHKHRPAPAELLEQEERTHRAQALSYLTGRPLFCARPFPPERLTGMLGRLDGLVDAFTLAAADALALDLQAAEEHLVQEAAPLGPGDLEAGLGFLRSARTLIGLLAAGDPEAIAAFCAGDPEFIRAWGLPVHYRVLRRA